MKKIKFNEKLESLIDEEGVPYQGRRFSSVQGRTLSRYSDAHPATLNAISRLEEKAEEKGADAYEIINSTVFHSKQEYDSTPFTASVSAILYKNR